MNWVEIWYGRGKVALHMASSIVRDHRDRGLSNNVLKSANLPLAETGVRALFNDLRSIPAHMRAQEQVLSEARRRVAEASPFLKAARLRAPNKFSWQGAATIVLPDKEITGSLHVTWDGSEIVGTHRYIRDWDFAAGGHEIPAPVPGKVWGPDRHGSAQIPEAHIEIERVTGDFDDGLPGQAQTPFAARRLAVGDASDAEIHRYLYRGGRLRGWRERTERIETKQGTAERYQSTKDSFDTILFKRPARFTQVSDNETDQREQILGVTVSGTALSNDDQHALWLMLSFVCGNRLQTIAVEHFDVQGELLLAEYLSGVEYGAPPKGEPFDLRSGHTFDPATFTVLADGFLRLERSGFPLAIAIHHLQDANTSYTQVEIKNLLFCIHTLFEAWTEQHKQRDIETEKVHDKNRRKLDNEIKTVFGYDEELRGSVRDGVKFAYRRVGAVLQEMFFDSLGTILDSCEMRALRNRNGLFHNGFLKPKKDESQHAFLQRLVDDAATLRTLAHEALLKLAGYRGPFLDYRSWKNRWCTNDDPAGPAQASDDIGPVRDIMRKLASPTK